MTRHHLSLHLTEGHWTQIAAHEEVAPLLEALGVPVRAQQVRVVHTLDEPLTDSVLVVLEHPLYPPLPEFAEPPRYRAHDPELDPLYHATANPTEAAAVAETVAITPDPVQALADLLLQHQPVRLSPDGPIDSCSCGWSVWGSSHVLHVALAADDAGLLARTATVLGDRS